MLPVFQRSPKETVSGAYPLSSIECSLKIEKFREKKNMKKFAVMLAVIFVSAGSAQARISGMSLL